MGENALLSADALWLVAISPAALIAAILTACAVGAQVQARMDRDARPIEGDVEFWRGARSQQRRTLGTPEPAVPIPATISLYTATLSEARAYLAEARASRRAERREFGAIMRGCRA